MTAVARGRLRYSGADPSRRVIGWAVVIMVHLVVGWLLVTGMARKGLDFIKKPMEAAVIQEVIIPPPPPPPPPKEIKPPEPKAIKTQAPPPPFVPPPDVPPPVSSSAPAIASVAVPPVAPPVIAPPPPPAPPAPQVARQEMGVACPTQVPPDMPRQALRDGTEGVVKAQALIRDGTVRDVTILSGPRVFHAAVRNAMLQYRCVTAAGDVLAVQEFAFKID